MTTGNQTRLAWYAASTAMGWKQCHYVKANRGCGVLEFTLDRNEAMMFPSRAAAQRAKDAWMERDLILVTEYK